MAEKKVLVVSSGGIAQQLQSGDYIKAYEQLFGYSRTTISGTSTTAEEVLTSILIPANTLGNNDSIEIHALWGGTGSTSGTKNLRVRLHTSVAVAGTLYGVVTTTAATAFGFNTFVKIYQKNSASSQEGIAGAVAAGGWGGAGSVILTSSLNVASDMYLVFTTIKAVSSDPISINSFDVLIKRI